MVPEDGVFKLLNELAEFDLHILESLRQPLEDYIVPISQASGTRAFSVNFILVSVMEKVLAAGTAMTAISMPLYNPRF